MSHHHIVIISTTDNAFNLENRYRDVVAAFHELTSVFSIWDLVVAKKVSSFFWFALVVGANRQQNLLCLQRRAVSVPRRTDLYWSTVSLSTSRNPGIIGFDIENGYIIQRMNKSSSKQHDERFMKQQDLAYTYQKTRRNRTSHKTYLALCCLAILISVSEAFIPKCLNQHFDSSLSVAQELLLDSTKQQKSKRPTNTKQQLKSRRKQTAINGYSLAMKASSSSSSSPINNQRTRQQTSKQTSIPDQRIPPSTIESAPDEGQQQASSQQLSMQEFNNRALYAKSKAVPDSMKHFVTEIHREDRITRHEEIVLGEQTQEAVRLNNIYDQLKEKYQREPTDEEWCAASGKINMEAISQAIDDGLSAKNKLVTSNLRMVQSVVNTYLRNGLAAHYNAGDLMQEGILALIRAAEKFEPERGFKFSTYAMYWVRASVKRSQVSQSRIIALPQKVYDDAKKLRRMEAELYTLTGTKPPHYELAVAAGMTEKYVRRCLEANSLQVQSLDSGLVNVKRGIRTANEDDSLAALIADDETESAEEFIARQDMMRYLQRHLSTEQLLLLLLRYGVVGQSPATIAELSDLVGQTPDKVRRRIKHSLIQLKEAGIEDEWMSFAQELAV